MVHLNKATTKLDLDQLVMATKHMNQLQTLDIRWNTDLNQFVYIVLQSMKATNLKELKVRVKTKERELVNMLSKTMGIPAVWDKRAQGLLRNLWKF